MRHLKKQYRTLMNAHNRTLFLLQLFFMLVFLLLILPLISIGVDYVLGLWGQSYLTDKNLLAFIMYPPAFLLILLFLALIAVFLFISLTTHLQYCNYESMEAKPNFLRILAFGLIKGFRGLFSGNLALPFYSLLLYILMNIPVLVSLILHVDLKVHFPGGSSDAVFVRGLILLFLFFLSFVALRGIFVLHSCIHDRVGFAKGFEASKALLHQHLFRTVLILLTVNISLSLLFYLLYNAVLFIMAFLVYLFTDNNITITVFLSLYPKITIYFNIFFSLICTITNFNIISTLYCNYRKGNCQTVPVIPDTALKDPEPLPSKTSRKLIMAVILIITAAGLMNLYLTVQNDSYNLKGALIGIRITSHRGNSIATPENTLPSLESAIEARADYAEIDVQQTKDGTIVLLHDYNLWRTTGLNKYLWELDYNDVRKLDAGSWFSEEFTGVYIPTLEEALEFSKGRIRLNIEVKIHGHEQELEEQLVRLIEEYHFENQCIVSSTNYTSLVKIKELNDEVHTGYIISAAYGNFYNKEYIDFFSMRSTFITRSIVESVHRSGKEIHAWTVNSEYEIERMKSLGVDNIITDNPYFAMEVLYRDDTNDSLIELLDRMLSNRSLYHIVKQNR